MSKRHPNVFVRIVNFDTYVTEGILRPQCSLKAPKPHWSQPNEWLEYVPMDVAEEMVRKAVEADRASRSNAEVIWPEEGAQPEPVYKEQP